MTRKDHQIIFTALAFLKLAETKGGDVVVDGSVRRLATLIDEYCFESVHGASTYLGSGASVDTEATQIDKAIENHITELREKETTRLPEDRETLLKFYDRLQQRKTRRVQEAFYKMGDDKIIADRVLKYLDEEIEDLEAGT